MEIQSYLKVSAEPPQNRGEESCIQVAEDSGSLASSSRSMLVGGTTLAERGKQLQRFRLIHLYLRKKG